MLPLIVVSRGKQLRGLTLLHLHWCCIGRRRLNALLKSTTSAITQGRLLLTQVSTAKFPQSGLQYQSETAPQCSIAGM